MRVRIFVKLTTLGCICGCLAARTATISRLSVRESAMEASIRRWYNRMNLDWVAKPSALQSGSILRLCYRRLTNRFVNEQTVFEPVSILARLSVTSY